MGGRCVALHRTKVAAVASGLVSALFVTSAMGAAKAREERVLSFHADVTLNADASLEVVETIRVRSARRAIDHGIYRDFPTHVSVPIWSFQVVAVTRDGRPEPLATEVRGNVTRVRVGDPSVRLKAGVHTFTLAYRTANQLQHLADRDELTWNVTGDAWTLPIDEASAAVHLPAGPAASARPPTGSTGVAAGKGFDFTATRSPDGATFRTTRPLAPGEALTIVLAWPKGLLQPPEAPRTARAPASRPESDGVYLRRRIILGIFVVVVLGGLILLTWRSRRDPDAWLYDDDWSSPRHDRTDSSRRGGSSSGGGAAGGGGW